MHHRSDNDAMARKLEALGEELPEQERNVLEWIADRARAVPRELSDEELASVGGGELADALGYDTESIKVSWSLSF